MRRFNNRRWHWIVFALAGLFLTGCPRKAEVVRPRLTLVADKGEALTPPVAKKVPTEIELHGDKRIDNYAWLRSEEPAKDEAVMDYLKAENAYTEAALAHTKDLQKKVYQEILARIKQTDLSVPVRIGEYFYFTRTEEGKNYPIHCRKKGSLEAQEEILLDENKLAQGHEFFALGAFKVSENHQLLAYSVDLEGNERFTLRVRDLSVGRDLVDTIVDTGESVVWASDNKTLFYTMRDETERPYRLLRHRLGGDPENDEMVFEEKDAKFFLGIEKTKSRKYLLLSLDSKTTSEVWYLKTSDPQGPFHLVRKREKDIQYGLDHFGDKFLIVTNENAKNFKLMEAPVSEPGKENWKEVIPHRADVKLDGVEVFENHLVFQERVGGLPTLRVRNLKTGAEHALEFPEPAYSVDVGPNPEFNTQIMRFTYSSLVSPSAVYDYDLETKTRELKKEHPVLGGYDRKQYVTERIFATAADGVKVPISLVYKKGLEKNGHNPCLLEGYGAYGINEDAGFDSTRLSLLDRGFVYAIAHIRGGGEMGRYWYEDGKLGKKKNSFGDFIAAAEHLVKEKYTAPAHLAITGASAGGLLMGAVTNMRPDLFHVVVAQVPFVDTLNTMLDETIPLTVTEYEEWGNPNEKEAYETIRTYSPYDNVKRQAYPHMLIMGSLSDTRVSYWEPAKWTAKLRALKTDKNLLVFKTNLNAGHAGSSGRYEALEEEAFVYTFMLDRLGVKE